MTDAKRFWYCVEVREERETSFDVELFDSARERREWIENHSTYIGRVYETPRVTD